MTRLAALLGLLVGALLAWWALGLRRHAPFEARYPLDDDDEALPPADPRLWASLYERSGAPA